MEIIKKEMKTPYFCISQRNLDDNIASFKNAMLELFPNGIVSYSLKTNSLPWLLEYLNRKGVFAEVVSDEEYDLALKCGYKDSEIVFNGPIKGEYFFRRALKNKAIINLDSKNDLKYIKKHGCDSDNKIGVRVNIPTEIFDDIDIGYEADGFRFGFSERSGELENAIEVIESLYGNRKFGLHLHCNSVTRSINVYKAISRYLC